MARLRPLDQHQPAIVINQDRACRLPTERYFQLFSHDR
jgi:hypothetical protein